MENSLQSCSVQLSKQNPESLGHGTRAPNRRGVDDSGGDLIYREVSKPRFVLLTTLQYSSLYVYHLNLPNLVFWLFEQYVYSPR